MGFITYDLIFLGLFSLFVILFLSTRKKNLKRQGILFLYRTKFGIAFIDTIAKKFEKLLRPMQYLVLASGYVLMVTMIWLFVKSVYLYLTLPIARVIRAPPVAPLIPYFPKIFGLEAFFPPLYFTYFIIAIGVVALSHEAAHGIFARLHNFKVHSTGFVFLGPIPGAFVEPDEKQMAQAKKFQQLTVLAAGTFANVIMATVFGLLITLFFSHLFVPAGVKFNSYALSEIAVADISLIRNSSIDERFVSIEVGDRTFFVDSQELQQVINDNISGIVVFDNSPAFRAQLRGAITHIDGRKIDNYDKLTQTLLSYKPGDEVTIETAILEQGNGMIAEKRKYEIVLDAREGRAFLGIGFFDTTGRGIVGLFIDNTFSKIKDPQLHYESAIGDVGWFVYYLLWWIVVINVLVALFNMLPLGILDGGRFFYLNVLGLTGSERIGRKIYKGMTWFLLALLAILMVRWVIGFF